ncbi:MAG: hypothetical protein GVY20_06920 [Bacteroidetes bacterium]|jgi:hypothetical protein|nr:hypothetical protein [Bacteroidota bacterium]
MKIIKIIFSVSVLILLLLGCENVNEPLSYEDGAVPAFVTIDTENQEVAAGGSLEIVFELGQTQYENVTVEYSISGDAIEGEDYTFASGTPGSVVIEHDSESTGLDQGSISLAFPVDAAFGTTKDLIITLQSATTESGESLELGRGEIGAERTYTIGGLVEIQEGTYAYNATGDFGAFSGTFEVTVPEEPVEVGGTPYFITTSNITGPLFGAGAPTPYAFNVTAGGAVIGAPNSHVFPTRVMDISGSYNSGTGQITFNATFQCCGAAGFGYQMVASPQ